MCVGEACIFPPLRCTCMDVGIYCMHNTCNTIVRYVYSYCIERVDCVVVVVVVVVVVGKQDLVGDIEEGKDEETLGDVVEEELAATSQAVEEAARRIQVRTRTHTHTLSLAQSLSDSFSSSLHPSLPLIHTHHTQFLIWTIIHCRRCWLNHVRMTLV